MQGIKDRFFLFVFGATARPVGQFLLIHEVTRSHTTTHYSWYDSFWRVISSSQRPLPDNTQHSTTEKRPNHDLSRRAAEYLRLRPRDHWERQQMGYWLENDRQNFEDQIRVIRNFCTRTSK